MEIRDSYIIDECISGYKGNLELLKKYIECENEVEIVKRNVTLKSASYARLKELADIIEKPVACTLRALIAIAVNDAINNSSSLKHENRIQEINALLLNEKLLLLEKKVKEIEKMISELKDFFE